MKNLKTLVKFKKELIFQKSYLVHILITIFGISAWLGINAIFVQLPLLVNKLPEKWDLAMYIVILIQAANIGPMLYALTRKFGIQLNESRWIFGMLLFGACAMCLLTFLYDKTVSIGGKEYSLTLFLMTFFTALVDCSSSLLFMPYLRHFREIFLVSYFIGEGLSGIIPSVIALVQGIGSSECDGCVSSEPKFSSHYYFAFIFVLLSLSLIAFLLLENLDSVRSEKIDNCEKIAEEWQYSTEGRRREFGESAENGWEARAGDVEIGEGSGRKGAEIGEIKVGKGDQDEKIKEEGRMENGLEIREELTQRKIEGRDAEIEKWDEEVEEKGREKREELSQGVKSGWEIRKRDEEIEEIGKGNGAVRDPRDEIKHEVGEVRDAENGWKIREEAKEVTRVKEIRGGNEGSEERATKVQENREVGKKGTEVKEGNEGVREKGSEAKEGNREVRKTDTEIEEGNRGIGQKDTEVKEENGADTKRSVEIEERNEKDGERGTEMKEGNGRFRERGTKVKEANGILRKRGTEIIEWSGGLYTEVREEAEIEERVKKVVEEDRQMKGNPKNDEGRRRDMEKGGRDMEEGGRDKEEVGRDKEKVGRDKEKEGRDKEEVGRAKKEGRDKEKEGRDKEEVGRDKEKGGRDKEKVGRAKKEGRTKEEERFNEEGRFNEEKRIPDKEKERTKEQKEIYKKDKGSTTKERENSIKLEESFGADAKKISKLKSSLRIYLYFLLGVMCLLGNGFLPGIQSYSALPYGSVTYHLTVTLSQLANPTACFLAMLFPPSNSKIINWLSVISFVICFYVVYLAFESPNPPLQYSLIGQVLVILSWILLMGLISYVKLAIASIFRHESQNENLFRIGIVMQLGSASGAVVSLILISFTSLLKS